MVYNSSLKTDRIRDLSLADVVASVCKTDLPRRRRQEILSALRTVGRALGRSLELIPADPRRLSAHLKEVAPLAIGVSQRRWNNVRALVRAGLTVVQPVSPGRHLANLLPAWEALWQQLPSPRLRMKLSRFLGYCSVSGIPPEAVTEATFNRYRTYLSNSLLKNKDAIFNATGYAWRAAQIAVDGWPIPDFPAANTRNWTLPWRHFPASLRDDCMSWSHQVVTSDPFEDHPGRPIRPITADNREWQIRSFASALVLRGRDPNTVTSLKDLVEIEAFKEGLRFFIERKNDKPTTGTCNLARGLKAVARHHVRVDHSHLHEMGRLIGKLLDRVDDGANGLTEKNRARLRPLDDPKNAIALLQLPQRLMGIAVRNRNRRSGALQAQAAVAIEILIMTAMRIGNLVRLDLEQNMIYPSRGNAMHLVIDHDNVKNRQSLDFPLPEESIELLERYLREFRPLLAPAGSTALFPGGKGLPKTTRTLRQQISDTVHSYTGLRVNPHLFRHAMGKLFLDANPGQYEVLRRVYGHKSIHTTSRYYTGQETAAAIRLFDQTILRLRKEEAP